MVTQENCCSLQNKWYRNVRVTKEKVVLTRCHFLFSSTLYAFSLSRPCKKWSHLQDSSLREGQGLLNYHAGDITPKLVHAWNSSLLWWQKRKWRSQVNTTTHVCHLIVVDLMDQRLNHVEDGVFCVFELRPLLQSWPDPSRPKRKWGCTEIAHQHWVGEWQKLL